MYQALERTKTPGPGPSAVESPASVSSRTGAFSTSNRGCGPRRAGR
jgi:hypothetical protein